MSYGYADLERELADAPMTWIPALLRTLIQAAIRKQVFTPDGLKTFLHSCTETPR